MKENKKLDLIWIIPEIIGEFFLILYIPFVLLGELPSVGVLSATGLVYMAIIVLLLSKIRMTGLQELDKVRWFKQDKKSK